MLLRLMGNDVRIASDGLEAVEQAAAFQPDIVLMDIGMPRLDGYEAARRIRNQSWSRDTLLVAVTGWGPSDDDEQATAAGFDRHFTKPLDPAELRRLVTESPPALNARAPLTAVLTKRDRERGRRLRRVRSAHSNRWPRTPATPWPMIATPQRAHFGASTRSRTRNNRRRADRRSQA